MFSDPGSNPIVDHSYINVDLKVKKILNKIILYVCLALGFEREQSLFYMDIKKKKKNNNNNNNNNKKKKNTRSILRLLLFPILFKDFSEQLSNYRKDFDSSMRTIMLYIASSDANKIDKVLQEKIIKIRQQWIGIKHQNGKT